MSSILKKIGQTFKRKQGNFSDGWQVGNIFKNSEDHTSKIEMVVIPYHDLSENIRNFHKNKLQQKLEECQGTLTLHQQFKVSEIL